MRKLIRYCAAAFLAWAVVMFAWAAFSHVTGVVGPAQASGASLELVANAVTLIDPPGALGAPQRFAAHQIRGAAQTAERVHQVPERVMGELLDRFGHAAAHDGRRHRHRHSHRAEVETHDILILPFDQLDGASERARRQAVLELERHRDRAEQIRERARDRARRHSEVTVRLNGQSFEWVEELSGLETEVAERVEAVGREVELLSRRMAQAGSQDRKDDILRRIDEILERLRRELEDSAVDVIAELEANGDDSPVRIHIRNR